MRRVPEEKGEDIAFQNRSRRIALKGRLIVVTDRDGQVTRFGGKDSLLQLAAAIQANLGQTFRAELETDHGDNVHGYLR